MTLRRSGRPTSASSQTSACRLTRASRPGCAGTRVLGGAAALAFAADVARYKHQASGLPGSS
jgi:hypothetical protein